MGSASGRGGEFDPAPVGVARSTTDQGECVISELRLQPPDGCRGLRMGDRCRARTERRPKLDPSPRELRYGGKCGAPGAQDDKWVRSKSLRRTRTRVSAADEKQSAKADFGPSLPRIHSPQRSRSRAAVLSPHDKRVRSNGLHAHPSLKCTPSPTLFVGEGGRVSARPVEGPSGVGGERLDERAPTAARGARAAATRAHPKRRRYRLRTPRCR